MKLKIVPLFLFLSIWLTAQNCNHKLQIHIIDDQNHTEISGAKVYLNQILLGETVGDGDLTLKNICSGKNKFEVVHPDFEKFEIELDVRTDKNIHWHLSPKAIQLSDAETTATQSATEWEKQIQIDAEEIAEHSAASLGDVLKTKAGISALSTGNSIVKPMIHGMHSSRVLILNQGVRQEDMEWGVEHAPNVDLNAFSGLEIVKGGSALRYGGDAIGGVVLAKPIPLPKTDTLQGKANLTGLSNGRGGGANIQLKKGFSSPFALMVQASALRIGDNKAPDYYLNNTGVYRRAMTFSGGYLKNQFKLRATYSLFNNKLGIFSATHIGNLTDLWEAINADEPVGASDFSYTIKAPYQRITHHLAKIEAEKKFNNGWWLSSHYAFQYNRRRENDIRLGELADTPSMDTRLTTHSGELFAKRNINQKWHVSGGINGRFQRNYSNPDTESKRLIPDYYAYAVGAFAETEYRPAAHWSISGGLRYDFNRIDTKKYYYIRNWEEYGYDDLYQDHILGEYGNEYLTHFINDYHNVSANAAVWFVPKQHHRWGLHYSFANRPPNPAELFSEGLHHSAMVIEKGDVGLNSERSHKWAIENIGDWKIGSGISWNIMGYYNHIQDYIYQIPTGAEYTIRGAFPVWSYRQIDAEIWGIDANLTVNIDHHFSSETQISWLHGQDLTHKVPLINMPPFEWNQSVAFHSDHGRKPKLRLMMDWVGRQNRFPNYNFEINVIENNEIVTKEVDMTTSPDAYVLFHLQASMDLWKAQNPVRLSMEVNNILNTSYRNYLNRFRYFADEPGRQIKIQLSYEF